MPVPFDLGQAQAILLRAGRNSGLVMFHHHRLFVRDRLFLSSTFFRLHLSGLPDRISTDAFSVGKRLPFSVWLGLCFRYRTSSLDVPTIPHLMWDCNRFLLKRQSQRYLLHACVVAFPRAAVAAEIEDGAPLFLQELHVAPLRR